MTRNFILFIKVSTHVTYFSFKLMSTSRGTKNQLYAEHRKGPNFIYILYRYSWLSIIFHRFNLDQRESWTLSFLRMKLKDFRA